VVSTGRTGTAGMCRAPAAVTSSTAVASQGGDDGADAGVEQPACRRFDFRHAFRRQASEQRQFAAIGCQKVTSRNFARSSPGVAGAGFRSTCLPWRAAKAIA